MCKLKSFGGIGFKKIHDFNIAMLGKQCWKLMTTSHSLVARILKAKYYPRSAFTDASVGFNPSYTWRSIMASKHVAIQVSRMRIGSGLQVQINKDPWLPDADNGCITTVLDESLAIATVNCLRVPGQRRWAMTWWRMCSMPEMPLLLCRCRSVLDMTKIAGFGWLIRKATLLSEVVTSCYKLLNPISNATSSKVWKSLWRLEVPSKVKHFIWRALMNILPTTDNLLPRKVEVSPICPICSAANEYVLHCLVECLFAHSCWLLSSIGTVRRCSSFFEWIEEIFTRCSKEDCKLAVMVCWRLWFNRNDKVWNGHVSRAQNLVNAAGHYLFQWQEAGKTKFTIVESVQWGHGSVCWSKPLTSWLKRNVDARVFRSHDSFSFGGVIRDAGGTFVVAKCQCFPGLFHPHEAEVLAVREALNWIKNLQISKIIFEINCLTVYLALINQAPSLNDFGLIIQDCQALAKLVGEVNFSFVRRSANIAAHTVARVGGSMSGPGEWRFVPPPWLCPMLTISYA